VITLKSVLQTHGLDYEGGLYIQDMTA